MKIPTMHVFGPRDGEVFDRDEEIMLFGASDINEDRGFVYVYAVDEDDPTRAYFTGQITGKVEYNAEPLVAQLRKEMAEVGIPAWETT